MKFTNLRYNLGSSKVGDIIRVVKGSVFTIIKKEGQKVRLMLLSGTGETSLSVSTKVNRLIQ